MYISCCLCIFFALAYVGISRRKGRFQWNTVFSPEYQTVVYLTGYPQVFGIHFDFPKYWEFVNTVFNFILDKEVDFEANLTE